MVMMMKRAGFCRVITEVWEGMAIHRDTAVQNVPEQIIAHRVFLNS